jgi:hypothetical protein
MINPAALSAIAELFLMNGDMCAWLYTGSPAMHSEKITLFEPETSRLKKAGAGTYGNSFIAIRRWAFLWEALAGCYALSLLLLLPAHPRLACH